VSVSQNPGKGIGRQLKVGPKWRGVVFSASIQISEKQKNCEKLGFHFFSREEEGGVKEGKVGSMTKNRPTDYSTQLSHRVSVTVHVKGAWVRKGKGTGETGGGGAGTGIQPGGVCTLSAKSVGGKRSHQRTFQK